MDVVYIVRDGVRNTDLRISLRSLAANVSGYDNVFISGYKPRWVSDIVRHIPTEQSHGKWLNAYYNVVAACSCPDVSDDFVLFNDDFFAVDKVVLPDTCNCCRGTLDEAIEKFRSERQSRWRRAHQQAKELLTTLGAGHYANFALHMLMVLNKRNFLRMANLPQVKAHIKNCGILSFRTIYGNMYWTNPVVVEDCKAEKGRDIVSVPGKWLSVFDNVTDWIDMYPNIKRTLSGFSGVKCRFER